MGDRDVDLARRSISTSVEKTTSWGIQVRPTRSISTGVEKLSVH